MLLISVRVKIRRPKDKSNLKARFPFGLVSIYKFSNSNPNKTFGSVLFGFHILFIKINKLYGNTYFCRKNNNSILGPIYFRKKKY